MKRIYYQLVRMMGIVLIKDNEEHRQWINLTRQWKLYIQTMDLL